MCIIASCPADFVAPARAASPQRGITGKPAYHQWAQQPWCLINNANFGPSIRLYSSLWRGSLAAESGYALIMVVPLIKSLNPSGRARLISIFYSRYKAIMAESALGFNIYVNLPESELRLLFDVEIGGLNWVIRLRRWLLQSGAGGACFV